MSQASGGTSQGVQDGLPLAASPRWHIGARQLRGAITAYAKRFDLLEVRVALAEAAAPSLATLRRWRKAVAPHFVFSVVAGPELSRCKLTEEAERELAAARAAVDALQARCFVLRTPAEVTPAEVWRQRIGKVLDRFPRDATNVVWEPSGVWEVEDAAEQAKVWSAVLAVDPAREMVPAGPLAYVRLRAIGETRSFGPAALERIIAAVGARREVFAVIETDSAAVEAKRLRQLARSFDGERRLGGGGRLMRPRSTIVVRDDEQE